MPRDLQPAFVRKTKARTAGTAGLSEVRGYCTTLYFTRKMERNAKKLLLALATGFASGIGKAVGAALTAYLLAQLVSWLLR
jgi:hypothetical protein